MAQTFNPEAIVSVLLSDGWYPCRDFALVGFDGGPAWKGAFTFKAADERGEVRFVTGPVASIVALKAKHIETAEEREERDAEAEQDRLALFSWQTYTNPATYEAAAEKQNGLCPDCGAKLEDYPITHYLAGRDVVLCQGCSPLRPRYGRP